MSLSRSNFEYIRELLRDRSAQSLGEDKSYLVEARLRSVAWKHGFESTEALVLRLKSRPSEMIVAEIVEAMTINETYFFRDGLPFDALRSGVIPDLLRHRAEERTLTIWSAACSTGQEPYSIAILLRHHFPVVVTWNIQIVASDISTSVLHQARQGFYSELEVSRGLTPDLLRAYFRKHGDGWQVREDLRAMVDFRWINLVGPWPALPQFDLVLLRNVLIYFERPIRQRVFARLRPLLRPNAYVLLGGAETTHNIDDGFDAVTIDGASFYQLRGARIS